MTREEAIEILKENYCSMCAYGSQNMESCDIKSCDNRDAIKVLEQKPTTKNDLALIHTEGLDEGIRCAMCTNSMKSDRGCDGSCAVNNAMYKKVMDVIESNIENLPSATTQEPILDKIRAEIEQLPITDTAVRLVAEILDKYKAESEE